MISIGKWGLRKILIFQFLNASLDIEKNWDLVF